MKRYFEFVGKRTVIEMDMKPPAAFASAAELSERLKTELRELDREEYNKLRKEYTK